ncbi:MAG: peroxiredoxin [Thermodesulfobacteriota bacterium]|nr:peroxiredoxin [Desulfovibrio sp.]
MDLDTVAASSPAGPPRIGDPAPAFEVETTQGTLRLDDYAGSWLVFFSHPADFTPVCTSEFLAFANLYPTFKNNGCELLALSTDSIYAHIAWTRSIEAAFGVRIAFPIVSDASREVAGAYGMLMPGESATETVRAVFVIDDRQIVRAVLHYPMTTGRNVEEILRLVQALRTTDRHGVATPAGWLPGDKVIVSPPRTQEMAEERVKAGEPDCRDWYYCLKNPD